MAGGRGRAAAAHTKAAEPGRGPRGGDGGGGERDGRAAPRHRDGKCTHAKLFLRDAARETGAAPR